MSDPDGAPADDPLLKDAYRRVAHAYELARAFVFDRYPQGVPPREELSPAQRARLEELDQAEAALAAARLRRSGE